MAALEVIAIAIGVLTGIIGAYLGLVNALREARQERVQERNEIVRYLNEINIRIVELENKLDRTNDFIRQVDTRERTHREERN